MEQIKAGEYVRFNDGHFDKIIDIRDTLGERKLICFEKRNSYLSDTSFKNMQVKHSKNPIDLIKKGDYVNGKYVYSIGTAIGNLPIINHTDGTFTPSNLIESIVTKEQFASMEYKVKD